MKLSNFSIYLLLILFFHISCSFEDSSLKREIEESKLIQDADLKSISTDSSIRDVEKRIMQSFVISKTTGELSNLQNIESVLSNISKTRKNSIVEYWLSYTYYYEAIFWYLTQNKQECENACKKGIETILKIPKKSSEQYALLSLLQNFSIQFYKGSSVAGISAEAKGNGQKALKMNDKNLRAYYVLALNDFYTPESFGGGEIVEEYAQKAIRSDLQSIANPNMPSWGKNLAYELLTRYYLKIGEKQKARNIYLEAISKYPDDYLINKLSKEFID